MSSESEATVVIGQSICAGCEDDYLEWQRKLDAATERYPGYLGYEVTPPTEPQSDWTGIYRFDSIANAQNWLRSSMRQTFLDEAAPMRAGPGTQQVIAAGNVVDDALVTVVVTHRVAENSVADFLAWQDELIEAQRRYPGFRGVEVFRPVDGVQDEWTICYKFDTATHLDEWLTSDDRRRLVGDSPFGEFKIRRIDHSFGNWFAFGDQSSSPPSDFKTSIAVWMGLYPTVVFLTLLITPMHLPLWSAMLLGNLLSSFAMTYLTMPYFTNRILGWWLRPKPGAPQPSTNLRGMLVVLLVFAVWAAVFYLVTTRIWHLP